MPPDRRPCHGSPALQQQLGNAEFATTQIHASEIPAQRRAAVIALNFGGGPRPLPPASAAASYWLTRFRLGTFVVPSTTFAGVTPHSSSAAATVGRVHSPAGLVERV